MKFNWIEIDRKSDGYTERAKIFNGWLVRTYMAGDEQSVALVFVPDENHLWEVESLSNI